ncbi:MAG: hypothetical protein KJ574_00200 [Nanoarchaeota archaeon]|nr:hypothetical protein [Nanoarchaeota archaeon]
MTDEYTTDEPRQTLIDATPIQKPEGEVLAQRIITQELLEEMQRGDDGSRVAGIEQDEHDLFHKITKALDISDSIKDDAIQRYISFKEGNCRDIENVMIQNPGPQILVHPRYNELFRRWTSLIKLMQAISERDINPKERVMGQFTNEEWAAKRYLHTLEQRASDREGGQLKMISYEGFNLGEVYSFLRILEDGDYGSWFGFPTDDVHKMNGAPHTVEALLPWLAKFRREAYNPNRGGKFLYREGDCPLSTLLYTTLISRADQAGEKETMAKLDAKTRRQYQFTKDNLGLLLVHTVADLPLPQLTLADKKALGLSEEASWLDVPAEVKNKVRANQEQEWADDIASRDKAIRYAIGSVLADPDGYHSDEALQMRELQHLIGFVPAYNQIMADDSFSDSERAMFNLALELTGIRRQDTRDLLLSIQRDANGNIVGQSPEGMNKFYESRFFIEGLTSRK